MPSKKIITVPFLNIRGLNYQPALSAAGKSCMYFNRITNKMMISTNGSAYVEFGTGGSGGGGISDTILTLALNGTCNFNFYEVAGGSAPIVPTNYTQISFKSSASVSRTGLTQSVQLFDLTNETELAENIHSSVTASTIEVTVTIPSNSILEVRHKVNGALVEGDVGYLVAAQLNLQA